MHADKDKKNSYILQSQAESDLSWKQGFSLVHKWL